MTAPAALRVLVVDDEPPARKRLTDLLRRRAEVAYVRECQDGDEAVAALRSDGFDLVLLDVQMPGRGGLDVLRELGPDAMPATILVTAHDQYAVQAFELHALDYLLKPFDNGRFDLAFYRALRRLGETAALAALRRDLGALLRGVTAARPAYPQHVALEARGRLRLVRTAEIDWVEAKGNYVRVRAGGEPLLCRATLNAVEAQLDPRRFFRCHRSVLVNLDRVREVQDLLGGRHRLLLADGSQLPLSRRQRRALPLLGRPAL